MKFADVVTMCVVCSLLVGCEERVSKQEAGKKLDMELVNVLNNIELENAIVAQHTLYPYHFVQDGETLNKLGQRDLAVLARHFAKHPGSLNIRRGDTPAELYDARVAQAVQQLKQAGVSADQMSISDGMPGGTGLPSERVVMILIESTDKRYTTRRTSGTGRITE